MRKNPALLPNKAGLFRHGFRGDYFKARINTALNKFKDTDSF